MPWVRLSDDFYRHDKWVKAGPLAGWLGVAGIAYCNDHLTDGFIPFEKVPVLANFGDLKSYLRFDTKPRWRDVEVYDLALRLCEVDLWVPVKGGYMVKNYLEYQEASGEILARREQRKLTKSEAGKLGGIKSGQHRRSKRRSTVEAPSKQTKHTPEATSASEAPLPTTYIDKSSTHSNLVVVGSEEERLLRSIEERTGAQAWGAPREKALALAKAHSFECIEWVMAKAPKDLKPPLLIDWLTTEMAGEGWIPSESQVQENRNFAATFAEHDPERAKHYAERAEQIERIRAAVSVQRETAV